MKKANRQMKVLIMVCTKNFLFRTNGPFWAQKWHILIQASAYEKQRRAIIAHLITKFCRRVCRRVKSCTRHNDYPFQNTRVFSLLQQDVRTMIKLKLKQASKEFKKGLYREKIRARLAKTFLYLYRDFTKFVVL